MNNATALLRLELLSYPALLCKRKIRVIEERKTGIRDSASVLAFTTSLETGRTGYSLPQGAKRRRAGHQDIPHFLECFFTIGAVGLRFAHKSGTQKVK